MRKAITGDQNIAMTLAEHIADLDSRYDGEYHIEGNEDILAIRRAMVLIVKDWFCVPSEWKKFDIDEI